ncbi:STAS/SEC14 domain-containing protein [Rhodovibrionaceae bacterium A322]
MLKIEVNDSKNYIHLSPDGPLSQGDFEQAKQALNSYINERDSLPSIMIEADQFPGWADFSSFVKHMKLVSDNHNLIAKVAIVGDSAALTIMPSIVDHFTAARVHHFASADKDKAEAWLALEDRKIGEFEILEGLPSNVLGLHLKGIITADDYRDTLIPLVNEKLTRHDSLNGLFKVSDDYLGFTVGAVIQDGKMGLTHLHDFKRIALVTDSQWFTRLAHLFSALIKGEIQVFASDDFDSAVDWVKH